uniref:Uncharacterized protein n=1 Tax=Glossina palpalis gambiensis TaxID=67801 RepID=A0A1B0AWI1_9MUSC
MITKNACFWHLTQQKFHSFLNTENSFAIALPPPLREEENEKCSLPNENSFGDISRAVLPVSAFKCIRFYRNTASNALRLSNLGRGIGADGGEERAKKYEKHLNSIKQHLYNIFSNFRIKITKNNKKKKWKFYILWNATYKQLSLFKDFVQNARVNNNNNNNINSCCDFKTIKRESYRCGGKGATVSIENPVVAQIVLWPWEASFLWR